MQGIIAGQVVAIGRLIAFATGHAAAHGAAVGRLVLLDIALSQFQQRGGGISLVREHESRGNR